MSLPLSLGGKISRRTFFFGGAVLAGAASTGYMFGRKPVRLGLIGAGGQGTYLAATNAKAWWYGDHCGDIRALCDVHRQHAEQLRHTHCRSAEIYDDYRKVLERDDIEAVIVATPDHWHAQIAAQALRAGKAVYCEKPISLTIREGQQLVDTVRETGQVFLGGTLQRSMKTFRSAVELARNGRLGTLRNIVVTLPERWIGESQGPFPAATPPADLQWNAWLGQAPWADFCPQRCHGFFRRWYEYSGGQMTDWGAHHIDIAHWAMDMDQSGPISITAEGVLPTIPNGFNTPIRFCVDMIYPNGVRLHVRSDPNFAETGLRLEGDQGWLKVNRESLEGPAVDDLRNNPLPRDSFHIAANAPAYANRLTAHLLHFYRCVRGGDTPVSDVVSQHRSTTACHLANIALRTGRSIRWNAATEAVANDAEAQGMLARHRREGFEL